MNGSKQGDSCPLTVSGPDLPRGTFPREFTCDGANRLPRLQWSTPPSGTQEVAIEMPGPNAPGGTFTHWLVCGLPPGISSLAAVPAGAAEGVSDFGRHGHGGPCRLMSERIDVRADVITAREGRPMVRSPSSTVAGPRVRRPAARSLPA